MSTAKKFEVGDWVITGSCRYCGRANYKAIGVVVSKSENSYQVNLKLRLKDKSIVGNGEWASCDLCCESMAQMHADDYLFVYG